MSLIEQRSLSGKSPRRIITFAVVLALHIAAIAALMVGLNPHVRTLILSPITLTPVHLVTGRTPPPPVSLQTPERNAIPKPVFELGSDEDRSSTITLPRNQTATSPVPAAAFVPAQAIASTHSTPDYPPIATRLGHEGNVLLKLSIDETGAVVDASVLRSSGYVELDQAAIDWVKAHWRYTPATRGGTPVAATVSAIITFRLLKD